MLSSQFSNIRNIGFDQSSPVQPVAELGGGDPERDGVGVAAGRYFPFLIQDSGLTYQIFQKKLQVKGRVQLIFSSMLGQNLTRLLGYKSVCPGEDVCPGGSQVINPISRQGEPLSEKRIFQQWSQNLLISLYKVRRSGHAFGTRLTAKKFILFGRNFCTESVPALANLVSANEQKL